MKCPSCGSTSSDEETFDLAYLRDYRARNGLSPEHPLHLWWTKMTDPDYRKRFDAMKRSIPALVRGVMPPVVKFSLDLGCGTGWLTVALGEDSYTVGVDLELELLKMAHERGKSRQIDVDFVLASGSSLPFKKDIFDFVVCYYVLEHINNVDSALTEIVRILSSVGRIFVAVPSKMRIALGLSPPHARSYQRLFGFTMLRELFNEYGFAFHIIYPASKGWKRPIARLLRSFGVLKHLCGLRGYAERISLVK